MFANRLLVGEADVKRQEDGNFLACRFQSALRGYPDRNLSPDFAYRKSVGVAQASEETK